METEYSRAPEPGEQANEITALAGEAAPEVGKLPESYGKITNLAGDADLCKQYADWARTQILRFDAQDERTKFMRVGGTMDIADRMWRVSLNRDATNAQTKDTLSDVTSPMFHVQVRSITSGESAIFFSDDKMPAEYDPEINTTEYTERDGKLIAQQQNMLEQYTWDEDKRRTKIRQLLFYTNKYGVQLVGNDWAYRTDEVTENVPVTDAGKLPSGQWAKYKRVTKRRTVRDCPELYRVPIEDAWFDAQIPDIDCQRSVNYRRRMGIEDLYAMQADGYLMNVELLNQSHLYNGEIQSESPAEQRLINAGETSTLEKTGEVEVWTSWSRVPIKEKQKRKKTVGEWADGKTVPALYWGIFAGNLMTGSVVCLKLCRNPHWHKKIPLKLIHSHEDDKGAYSTGYATMLQSLYWQAVTNINQAVDSVTERNWAPMTANGPVHTRDLTFKKNKLIQLDRMTKLERLNIPDTTQITMAMADIIEKMANSLTGADKPVNAEPLGSRTSATEAKNIFDQAMMPLDEKAAFMAEQLFPWLLELDAAYWRQYGDPNTVISMTHNNMLVQVNPGELYGPIRTKVTALSRFRTNTMRRMELNSFLQNVAPIFVNVMGEEGLRILGREAFNIFGISKADEIFPWVGDYDATSRANSEVEDLFVAGVWVEPKLEENHKAHLAVLKPALRKFELLGDTPDENLQLGRLHIAMREELETQKRQRVNGAMESMRGGGQPGEQQEGLTGEIAQNPAEAEAGALANV